MGRGAARLQGSVRLLEEDVEQEASDRVRLRPGLTRPRQDGGSELSAGAAGYGRVQPRTGDERVLVPFQVLWTVRQFLSKEALGREHPRDSGLRVG